MSSIYRVTPTRSSAGKPVPVTVTTSLFEVASNADVRDVTSAEGDYQVHVRSISVCASSEVDRKTKTSSVGGGSSLAVSSILHVIYSALVVTT